MVNTISRGLRYLFVLLLALLSLFIYKLALQPAIHQFYEARPVMLLAYGLVLVAALVDAVLLGSLLLRFFATSLRSTGAVISVMVLLYCMQMSWLSPWSHIAFWTVVFVSYVSVGAAVLWLGQRLSSRMYADSYNDDHHADHLKEQQVLTGEH
ncbi:hypothetical protein ACF3NA_01600 [Alkanindiges sp. WGS2144]|uniref:hypothetical protein n=1 Tax=Alkanindiges sp. WGS2144 TaxID=3366808 RepID=UPI0037533658